MTEKDTDLILSSVRVIAFFRAVAGALLGDTELHAQVRKRCADFMEKEREFFAPNVTISTDDDVIIKILRPQRLIWILPPWVIEV